MNTLFHSSLQDSTSNRFDESAMRTIKNMCTGFTIALQRHHWITQSKMWNGWLHRSINSFAYTSFTWKNVLNCRTEFSFAVAFGIDMNIFSHSMSFWVCACSCRLPYLFTTCRRAIHFSITITFPYSAILLILSSVSPSFAVLLLGSKRRIYLILGWFDENHWSGKMKYFLYSYCSTILFFFFSIFVVNLTNWSEINKYADIEERSREKSHKSKISYRRRPLHEFPWNFAPEK